MAEDLWPSRAGNKARDRNAAVSSPRVHVTLWDTPEVAAGSLDRHDIAGRKGIGAPYLDAMFPSFHDLAPTRSADEKNNSVSGWVSEVDLAVQSSDWRPPTPPNGEVFVGVSDAEPPMEDETENKPVPGQTYYTETGGDLTREDLELMRQGRNWDDAPVPFSISHPDSASYQPQTSHAAMEKYQRMCRDNDSIVSRAATWGTRRLSLPSILDPEVQVAGNFLKKLSLSKGDTRRPSILEGLRGLVRRPSANAGKRSRADADDASPSPTESLERKETQAKLAPPSPKPGWPRKQTVPSINTAFVEVGSAVASIATAHARSGSISATPIASPRSPSGRSLSVKRPLNRLRSKSETSGIVEMWEKSGGPPVSNLGGQRVPAPEADDDEDDDDDLYEDGDLRAESDRLIDDVEPNFQGFQQHLLKLNPMLASTNNYLVDRIAHAQVTRYKALCQGRIKHLQAVNAKNCTSGSMCIALGGSANVLDSKGDQRGLDPLSARYEGSDGDATPLEGAINPDSFPQDIPMPPTGSLPAEFECQLCFTAKKFNKPSDWTKHVHEDVQPFTCTWDRCKDHKMFKRKADWVRHENEGHRHLEWWTCDVDDCRHRCYRRDNFLQHLVREHKFIEPKVKTKAAIKRAGGVDPTWVKVEQCHQETSQLPQQEPCRFCGKTFPTWKKLTVHLTKHMEHISLPVLKLVAKKELDENTIISPVQDPPPRTFPPTFSRQEQHMFATPPTISQEPMSHQPGPALAYQSYAPQSQPPGMYTLAPPQGYPSPVKSPGSNVLGHEGFQQDSTQRRLEYSSSALPLEFNSWAGVELPVADTPSRVQRSPQAGFSVARSSLNRLRSKTDQSNLSSTMTMAEERDDGRTIVLEMKEGRLIACAPDLSTTEMRQLRQALEAAATKLTEPIHEEAPIGKPSFRSGSSAVPSDSETSDQHAVGDCNAELDEGPRVTIDRRAHPPKQVGVANIRIELLLILRSEDFDDSGTVESFSDGEQDEVVDHAGDRSRDHSGGDPELGGGTNNDIPEGARGQSGDFGSSGGNQGGSGFSEEGDDGREGPNRKRRRLKSPEPVEPRPRLACPYQAYDSNKPCLQQGPRNRQGGADGIYRLKQHLRRRHMLSYRCQTCWRSLDSRSKHREHIESAGCREEPRPVGECFMDARHEAEIKVMCGSTSSQEDTWWRLFQLLIPGMDTREESWMKSMYRPYYKNVVPDLSFAIPSLNITNVTFSQLDNSISSNEFALPGSQIGQSTEQPFMVSQPLSIPVYESTQQPSQPSTSSMQLTPDFGGAASWTLPDLHSSGIVSSTSATSIQKGAGQSEPWSLTAHPATDIVSNNVTQLKRNNDRLKKRNEQAMKEIAELRDTNRAVLSDIRSDIRAADGVLEGMMNSGDLSDDMYEKLAELSKFLEAASEKLRRGC